MFTEEEILTIVGRIVDRVNPSKVYLFGSYAKGKATIKSDLDLLVVKDSNLPSNRRVADIKPLLSGYVIPVNVMVYTPSEIENQMKDEYSFVYSVLSSAREVYPIENGL